MLREQVIVQPPVVPEEACSDNSTQAALDVREILLDRIAPNPHQPRRSLNTEVLEELVASIRERGVLQAVLVRQIGPERYELIAGERRCCAARRAGLASIPAMVRQMTDREQAELALVENLMRHDLNPVETARAFRALMKDFDMTQQEVAERVGKSRSKVAHLMRLLELPEAALDSLERGEIQERHARTLLQVADNAVLEQLLYQVVTEGLSVKELEQRIRKGCAPEYSALPDETGRTEDPADQRRARLAAMTEAALSAELRKRFARRISVHCPYDRIGHIEIGFQDREDMIRLVDTLLYPTL